MSRSRIARSVRRATEASWSGDHFQVRIFSWHCAFEKLKFRLVAQHPSHLCSLHAHDGLVRAAAMQAEYLRECCSARMQIGALWHLLETRMRRSSLEDRDPSCAPHCSVVGAHPQAVRARG